MEQPLEEGEEASLPGGAELLVAEGAKFRVLEALRTRVPPFAGESDEEEVESFVEMEVANKKGHKS